MRPIASAAQTLLYRLDREWGRAYHRARRRLGWARPATVHPYRGYAADGSARVLARVLEDRGTLEWAEGRSIRAAILASWRRYATIEVPEAHVDVLWGDLAVAADTDEEGHLDVTIRTPRDVAAGWNAVRLRVPRSGRTGLARIFVAPPEARFVVVSDIDDTVIDTNVRHPLQRAAALFLTDSRTRLPFEGAGALYRALHGGKNPMVYLSSSPWNLYDHLDGLFERHRIPEGVLLLREWGISREGVAPLGGHGHKRVQLDRVLVDFPRLPLVLIGDSGQHDAQHYVDVAEANPGRVRAIAIRDVGTRSRRRLERIAGRARERGVPFCVAEDSVAAARFLAGEGILEARDVDRIARDERLDRRSPEPTSDVLR